MISFIFSSKKTTIKTSEVSDLMNFTQKRIEMMKAYSNAIDAFSNSDNQKAYEEMVQASKIARELADSTTDYDDTREYTTLADYYFAKAQSYLEKKDNDFGNDIYMMEPPTQGFNDFIGLDNIKKYLEETIIVPWREHKLKTRKKNSLLFYGPFGVGKTRFVHSLLKELDAKAYYFKPIRHFHLSDLVDVEHDYKQVFKEAEKQDNVIFFIEQPIPFFSDGQDDISKDTTELFIRLFQKENKRIKRKNLNIMLIATTSVPDKLSSKVFKKNLFDDIIYIPYPDDEIRKGMIERYFLSQDVDDQYKNRLVELTKGFVNTDLSRICKTLLNDKTFDIEKMENLISTFNQQDNSEFEKSVSIFENQLKDREIINK